MIKKILMLVLFVAPLSLAAQKYAHFDYTAVMQAMPEVKTAQTELEAIGKQYSDELQNMQKEIEAKYQKFQNEVNDQTPENIRTRRMQEIQDMQQRLEQASQDNQRAFNEAQQQKMQPIIQKVLDAVNAVAREGNYVYIIDTTASQAAGVFINQNLSENVTKKVMDKLGVSGPLTATPSTGTPAAGGTTPAAGSATTGTPTTGAN